LGLFYLTHLQEKHVMWIVMDEMAVKGSVPLYDQLGTSKGIADLGHAALEILATSLLTGSLRSKEALCVVEFRNHALQAGRCENRFSAIIRGGLERLVSLIHLHYPRLFDRIYAIGPCEEYLARLDIPDNLLRQTVLLQDPKELTAHCGPDVPSEYGGWGPRLANCACVLDLLIQRGIHENMTEYDSEGSTNESLPSLSDQLGSTDAEPRVIYSEDIGSPTIILDPEDLECAEDLCPNKMGARLVRADSNMVVKFGLGVRLAEAEALHLIAKKTTIAAPRLLSAYILDGTTYIVMSYEDGESLSSYWDRASEEAQQNVVTQLKGYVKQLREIEGDFIGGLDYSACRDGIFDAGFGDYKQYSYGPYASEEQFNEGIVQALRNRLSPRARKMDPESAFSTSEYILHQTVRSMKGHKIVLTHGDLHPENIIIRPDRTVVILDWGLAGYWPEYWEFYRAMFNPPWRLSWDREVEKFIPPYYVERSMMQKIFGIIWY
jgi:aminoglycoside phosphotransferase